MYLTTQLFFLSDLWYIDLSKHWLVPVKHGFEYGLLKSFFKALQRLIPKRALDDMERLIPRITVCSEFNRTPRQIRGSNGKLFSSYTMEDCANFMETIIPSLLSTTSSGRYDMC